MDSKSWHEALADLITSGRKSKIIGKKAVLVDMEEGELIIHVKVDKKHEADKQIYYIQMGEGENKGIPIVVDRGKTWLETPSDKLNTIIEKAEVYTYDPCEKCEIDIEDDKTYLVCRGCPWYDDRHEG